MSHETVVTDFKHPGLPYDKLFPDTCRYLVGQQEGKGAIAMRY